MASTTPSIEELKQQVFQYHSQEEWQEFVTKKRGCNRGMNRFSKLLQLIRGPEVPYASYLFQNTVHIPGQMSAAAAKKCFQVSDLEWSNVVRKYANYPSNMARHDAIVKEVMSIQYSYLAFELLVTLEQKDQVPVLLLRSYPYLTVPRLIRTVHAFFQSRQALKTEHDMLHTCLDQDQKLRPLCQLNCHRNPKELRNMLTKAVLEVCPVKDIKQAPLPSQQEFDQMCRDPKLVAAMVRKTDQLYKFACKEFFYYNKKASSQLRETGLFSLCQMSGLSVQDIKDCTLQHEHDPDKQLYQYARQLIGDAKWAHYMLVTLSKTSDMTELIRLECFWRERVVICKEYKYT